MRTILALSMIATSATLSQALPPGMTMHRTQAGVVDALGWTVASSTSGGFTVKLPCVFNDFTLKSINATDPVANVETVGCLRQDQRKFSASRFNYRNGLESARHYFESMPTELKFDGETFRRDLVFKGFPAFEIGFENASRCGAIRVLLIDSTLLNMTVEAPSSACDGLSKQAQTLFSSLQVEIPVPNKTMEPTR